MATAKSGRGAKRARVLETAAKTLNRFGVSYASLPNVAEQLGISRAALYYYFDDQEDLVFQSYQRSCEILADNLDQAASAEGGAMAMIERFIDGILGPDTPEIASLSDLAYLSEERRGIVLSRLRGIKDTLAGILEDGAREGALRPCASGIVAACILGLVSWPPVARFWRSSETLTHRDMVDAIKSLLREGIAADRTKPIEFRTIDIDRPTLAVDHIFDPAAMAAAKQESLLAAASWLFNLKGVDATSLDEVAMRLGVTKKVIYHNLGDKETLVAECYRRSFRFYADIARRVIAYEGPRLDAFVASTHAFATANLREDIAPLAPLSGVEALPDNVTEEINTTSAWLMDTFLELYEQGRHEGSIRSLNARAILAIHPGSFEWLPKWYDALSNEERALAPRELATLEQLGLLAI